MGHSLAFNFKGRPRLLHCRVKFAEKREHFLLERQIFGGRGNFPRQVMSQNYGANLASSSGKGGVSRRWENMRARKGRISNLHSRRGRGGGTGERPPQTDHDDQTKRGRGGGDPISQSFSPAAPSLLLQPRKEKERDICPTREREGGREDVYVVCGNNKGRSPPRRQSRVLGREGGGVDQTARGLRRRPSNALGGWLTQGEIHQRNQMCRHQRKEKVLLVGFNFLGPFP